MANPKLSSPQIDQIQLLILNWRAKPFNWDLLVDRIDAELDINITRQALSGGGGYTRIVSAYKAKKIEFKSSPAKSAGGVPEPSSNSKALIDTLRAERDRCMAFIKIINDKSNSNPQLKHLLQAVADELRRGKK
ncbi:MAG: hypothetical protein ACJA0I_001379 [Gammaproteobacteria bacterium]|jgi:hypothetical protein